MLHSDWSGIVIKCSLILLCFCFHSNTSVGFCSVTQTLTLATRLLTTLSARIEILFFVIHMKCLKSKEYLKKKTHNNTVIKAILEIMLAANVAK